MSEQREIFSLYLRFSLKSENIFFVLFSTAIIAFFVLRIFITMLRLFKIFSVFPSEANCGEETYGSLSNVGTIIYSGFFSVPKSMCAGIPFLTSQIPASRIIHNISRVVRESISSVF